VESPDQETVDQLLQKWRAGDAGALDGLISLVYDELRRVARRCLRGERPGQTLQTTGLVHEAYLRLARCGRVQWQDRAHFFAVATRLMRRVLVDAARRRGFQKRGGERTRVTLDAAGLAVAGRAIELVALDRALDRLADVAPRKARVVEMRFFGGLTIEETAAALAISPDIVKREWRTAKLWLQRDLG
jgi:RNA polymerase sigma factor (TIGR02999 family)